MAERRKADRYFSDELCKFEVKAKINDIAFSGYIFDISELGLGVTGATQDETKIPTGANITGYILSPDQKRKFHFDGTIVRKDLITYQNQNNLLLGIKFTMKIRLPDYIAMLAPPVGMMVD